MNCKYCNAELQDDSTLCPVCGKEQELTEEAVVEETVLPEAEVSAEAVCAESEETAEETELTENEEVEVAELTEGEETEEGEEEAQPAPKAKRSKIIAAIIAIVLVAATLIGLVVGGLSKPTASVEVPSNGDSTSPLCKASYTVSDKKAVRAADQVVATMEGKTLTNSQLQFYYWQEIYMFMQQNGSYAQFMGLDLSKPLDQQIAQMGDVAMSWQQFFLDGAISTWTKYQAMALEAEKENFQMPADRQAELDAMPADLEVNAAMGGFQSADALLQNNVGANTTAENYLSYTKTCYLSMAYLTDYCDSLEFTEEELAAFYEENLDYFIQSGITKDSRNINIRHVLLMPEGGETGENGYPVYTDEAWEACRQKAEDIYAEWKKGDLSEESFAELAVNFSEDGNAYQGGIYEDVAEGTMVPAFNDWCFDETRKVGDHGLVKTEYGYHIMFFCGSRDWQYYARDGLANSMAYDLIPEVVGKHTASVDFSKVKLANINFG